MPKKMKVLEVPKLASTVRAKLQAEPMLYVEYRGGSGMAPGAFVVWCQNTSGDRNKVQRWGCHFYNAEDDSLCQGSYNLSRSECLRVVAEWAGKPLKETTFMQVNA